MNAQLKELYRRAGDAVDPTGDVQQVLNRATRRRVATQVGAPLATAAAVAGTVGVVQPWSGSDAPVAGSDASESAGVAALPDPTMVAGNTYAASTSDTRGAPADAKLEITFHKGKFSATAGCNTFNGTYDMSDDVLMSSSAGLTAAYCPGSEKIDGWLESFLKSRPQVKVSGERLHLDNGTSDVTLAVKKVADKPFAGTNWRLDSIVASDAATVSSVPRRMSATLSYDDGTETLNVDSGCQLEETEVDVSDGSMTVTSDSDARTAQKCPAPSVDRTVREVLDGSVGYEIEGSQLRIQDDEGALVYTAN